MPESDDSWSRDDVIWITLRPFLFDEARMAAGEEEAEALISLAGSASGAWLDLGCGPGRHAVPLAARGASVRAIDASPALLEQARARSAAAGVAVEWVEADLARVELGEGCVDVAISMFTTLGYGSGADDLDLLCRVRRALRPGGRLIVELAGKECVAAADEPTRCDVGDEGALLFRRHWPIDDWARMDNHWVLVEGERARHFRFSVALYSGAELRALLLEAGFDSVELHSDLDGSPYGERPERLVAVARLD